MALLLPLSTLDTARLTLRAPMAADLEAIFEVHADPITNRFNPGGPMSSRQQAQTMLQSWEAHWQAQGYGYWAIALHEHPEQLLGFGGIMSKPIDGQAGLNLYFRFRPQAWGCGYASEMAMAALSLAFERLAADAVLAVVRPANMPSRKTLERIGMRLKGALSEVPGQAPSLLYEMSAGHYATVSKKTPAPTPFGA